MARPQRSRIDVIDGIEPDRESERAVAKMRAAAMAVVTDEASQWAEWSDVDLCDRCPRTMIGPAASLYDFRSHHAARRVVLDDGRVVFASLSVRRCRECFVRGRLAELLG